MKSLKESIFFFFSDIASNDTVLIEQFLKDNYGIRGSHTIKGDVVDVKGSVWLTNKDAESLTGGLFRFGKVKQSFYCMNSKKLKSLEGAPEVVEGEFYCSKCPNLTSLEGAPEAVGGDFVCDGCSGLTS